MAVQSEKSKSIQTPRVGHCLAGNAYASGSIQVLIRPTMAQRLSHVILGSVPRLAAAGPMP